MKKKLQEVELVSEQRKVRSLTCVADGYEYQVTSDERNLYFNKLGRDASGKEEILFGTTRVVKAEVEAVRCMRVNGKTVILIVFEGKTSRLVVKGNVKEAMLMQIFGGVPLKLSINAHSTTLTDDYELRLLSCSFLIALVRLLCYIMPEISFLGNIVELAWIVVPFFWLIPCASRMLKGSLRDQFPVGGGMFGSIFSCLMLWLTSFGDVENWSALVLPSVISAILIGVVYLIIRRKLDWKALAVVVLTSMVLFTPAASLCINHALPAWSVGISAAEIVSLNERIVAGEHTYSLTVNESGKMRNYHMSRSEYEVAEKGDWVTILHKTGLLGITYTEVDFE